MTATNTELRAEIRPILFAKEDADLEYRRDIGHTKRFIERWHADGEFRELLANDPYAAVQRYALERDPMEIRILWDREYQQSVDPNIELPLSVRRYLAYQNEKAGSRKRYRRRATPSDERFASWRRRMIQRCVSHLGGYKADYVVHAPMCFELTKGCSVGCWFCSVAAPRLSDQFAYTEENAGLWRETLDVFKEIAGPAAGMGFCYWASDPLDNPDYEKYLLDFQEKLGEFPQTTTAQAQKHVDRVRDLLKLSESKGGFIERFSVLTLKQWNQIHEAFDPAELVYVECIPQNKEAFDTTKSIAGRALDLHRKRVAKQQEQRLDDDQTFTTACVSGFLVNMVERSVRLITPCHASDRWPLGYWTVAEGNFSDGASLRALLEQMMAEKMPTSVRHDMVVRLRRDFEVEHCDDGFILTNRFWKHVTRGTPASRELGHLLRQGLTAAEVALALDERCGLPLEQAFLLLNELFDRGLLDEEPAGAQDSSGRWIPTQEEKQA